MIDIGTYCMTLCVDVLNSVYTVCISNNPVHPFTPAYYCECVLPQVWSVWCHKGLSHQCIAHSAMTYVEVLSPPAKQISLTRHAWVWYLSTCIYFKCTWFTVCIDLVHALNLWPVSGLYVMYSVSTSLLHLVELVPLTMGWCHAMLVHAQLNRRMTCAMSRITTMVFSAYVHVATCVLRRCVGWRQCAWLYCFLIAVYGCCCCLTTEYLLVFIPN